MISGCTSPRAAALILLLSCVVLAPPSTADTLDQARVRGGDVEGLLALRASICRAGPTSGECLPTWVDAGGNPCNATGFAGVFCNGFGRVVSIVLQLEASVVCFSEGHSPSVLQHLQDFTLECTGTPGAHTGALPASWAAALPGLVHLRVVGCGAEGPLPPLSPWPKLQSLALPSNRLSGPLPEQINLQALGLLDLRANLLTGTLPAGWASSSPVLEYVYLSHNALEGELPPAWGTLPALQIMDLSGNPDLSAGAPRAWLQPVCAREGRFVCLVGDRARQGSCKRYLYGSSDRHADARNVCDHVESVPTVVMLWGVFLASLAGMWLRFSRRVVRQRAKPESLAVVTPLLGAPGGGSAAAAGSSTAAAQAAHPPTSNGDMLRRRQPLALGWQPPANTWFQGGALLPPAALAADIVCCARLLVLWGLQPHPKFWPSWCLLAFLLAPHLLVALVMHTRIVAAAVLPPAFKAAAPGMRIEHQPVGATITIAAYSWLVSAPCWVAYPVMLVLMVPGVAFVMLCGPATLLLHLVGVVNWQSTQRYVLLLQSCVALTQAPATAVLLTFLFLWGNVPNWQPVLDAPLYFVPMVACMADILVAWYQLLSRPSLSPPLEM